MRLVLLEECLVAAPPSSLEPGMSLFVSKFLTDSRLTYVEIADLGYESYPAFHCRKADPASGRVCCTARPCFWNACATLSARVQNLGGSQSSA